MPLRSDWSRRTCAMARGFDILADPWALMVLREVFFGNGRFQAMKDKLEVADSVLSKRLATLTAAGLLVKRAYGDGGRSRYEYALTARGADTLPVLNAVLLWSEKHLDAPSDTAHMLLIHLPCGSRCESADTCLRCGERLTSANTAWHSLARTAEPVALARVQDSAA
ncbi:MAG: winged helix-turn-helix transcriptional regulator [Actinomycetales bacterium]